MKRINWTAFLRALIISAGVAVPLFIVFVIVSLYIPGSNYNGGFYGQVHEDPSNTWYVISTCLAFCLLFIDFSIGRRYYRSIAKAKPAK